MAEPCGTTERCEVMELSLHSQRTAKTARVMADIRGEAIGSYWLLKGFCAGAVNGSASYRQSSSCPHCCRDSVGQSQSVMSTS